MARPIPAARAAAFHTVVFGVIGWLMSRPSSHTVILARVVCRIPVIDARLTQREESAKSVEVGSIRFPYAGPASRWVEWTAGASTFWAGLSCVLPMGERSL